MASSHFDQNLGKTRFVSFSSKSESKKCDYYLPHGNSPENYNMEDVFCAPKVDSLLNLQKLIKT